MTPEDHALRQVRALAAPTRLRVRRDVEGWPVIPGRYGRIEWHDGARLAVHTDRPRLFPKLWTIPGVLRWQTGDQEIRALFPVEALDQVAGVIRARHRAYRPMTPERLAQLGQARRQKASAPPMGATSRLQEPSAGRGSLTIPGRLTGASLLLCLTLTLAACHAPDPTGPVAVHRLTIPGEAVQP